MPSVTKIIEQIDNFKSLLCYPYFVVILTIVGSIFVHNLRYINLPKVYMLSSCLSFPQTTYQSITILYVILK